MADQTDNNALPVFAATKPIGKCGICGAEFYPSSTCKIAAHITTDCPLNGAAWANLMLAYSMQNVFRGEQ